MVLSSVITITSNGESLMCGGFSLSETICLVNFVFIIDYFSSLSLSNRRGNVGAAYMGSTYSGASSPQQAMIEDSAEEFLMASRAEESFRLPSPRFCGKGAPPTPVMTT
jgi:hypothetical protein